MKGNVTNTGYWPDSPDRNNDFNIIPSNNITMEGMDMPLMGVSNKGDKKLMVPGKNYKFKGESVMETPLDKGMFLGKFKQVGGQLVPHDTDMASFQKGGEPIYVYSKDDPAYKKYLKQKAYYDKQKAIYEDAVKIHGQVYKGYDELVDQAYENAKNYKEKFNPDLGIPSNYAVGLPTSPDYKNFDYFQFRKPTPVILEKEAKPKAIDIKPLPTPPPAAELKPVLTKLPRPQTNKQRVVVNTPQGDKIRVQDIKTKKFLGWEDDKGLPSDVENPSGTASQDFPQMRRVAPPQGGFAYGGDISKDKGIFLGAYKQVGGQLIPHDISVPNLSRQEGGQAYDIPAQAYRDPKFIRDAEDREYYDPQTETIHMRSSYPNVIHEQWIKDHETAHHNQKLKGKLSSTENWPGPLKEPVVPMSEDNVMAYYNRGNIDVNNLIDAVPESTLFGMPDDVLGYGFQLKTYGTPGTAEYEASNTRNSTPRTLYRGKPVGKNAVAKTLNREEKDPEMMFKDKYNTSLTKEEEEEFNKWVAKESKQQDRDIMMDKGAYDIQGFWKSGDWKKKDADNHGTDTWKKPNHPTFSNQSKYNGEGGWYGGNWTEDAGYQPSKQSLNNYGPDYYNWMFGEEPNRPEHLDMSRYDGRNSPTPIVYQKGGPAKKFNTKLRGQEAEAFNQHAQQFPSLTTDTGDYDTQGFYKEVYNKNNGDMNAITAALTPGSPTAHVGNDRYKKPNHPTFSKESKYHVPILRPAGEWGRNDQGDYFNASRRNIKNMTESDGTPLDYFKRAEDYNQNGVPDTQLLYRGKSMFNTDAPAYELPEMKPSKLEYSGGGSVKRVKIKSLPNNWKSQ